MFLKRDILQEQPPWSTLSSCSSQVAQNEGQLRLFMHYIKDILIFQAWWNCSYLSNIHIHTFDSCTCFSYALGVVEINRLRLYFQHLSLFHFGPRTFIIYVLVL